MSFRVGTLFLGLHSHFLPTNNNKSGLEKMSETPFLSLAMDLPSAPLYRDDKLQNIIPQVPLAQLLAKYNGISEKVETPVCFSCLVYLMNGDDLGVQDL